MNTHARIWSGRVPGRARFGFTLIEVLLGVLILGLGLLGLASVFPLVVKKQRDAQDTVLGISSVKGVESVLRGHSGLNSELLDRGWAKFASRLKELANQKPTREVIWSDVLNAPANTVERIYGNTVALGGGASLTAEPGSIVFWGSGGPGSATPDTVVLRTSDRLIPQGPGVTPQYVWDIVPILAGPLPNPEPRLPTIRVAMFVRRIDGGIRVPSGKTLTEVIATGEAAAIAWSGGFPTFDGKLTGGASYAGFFAVRANKAAQRYSVKGETYNVLQFGGLAKGSGQLAAVRQIGQQLIDNDGNIYTVISLPQERNSGYDPESSVVISPPLTDTQAQAITTGGGTGGVVEFLVSPVIPASVEVADIRP